MGGRNPISRRDFLKAAVLTGAASLLAACGGTGEVATILPSATPPGRAQGGPVDYFVPNEPANTPVGTARGIFPGRVTWAHDPEVAKWDGVSGYWWEADNLDGDLVGEMLSQSLQTLTGTADDASAWKALFIHFNQFYGRSPGGDPGYQPGEKIAIKLNQNACTQYAYRGNHNFSSPQLALAVVNSLVEAGVQPADISLYDSTRVIPDLTTAYFQEAGLGEVVFEDFGEVQGGAGICQPIRRDARNKVIWSQEVEGSTTYLPTVVTEASYLVNLASLKGHSLAGVTLCGKNHFGTISADLDGKPSFNAPQGANIHGTIAAHDFDSGPGWEWSQCTMGTYNAITDLMTHPHLGEKTVLFMIEGFYAVHEQNTEMTARNRWRSEPFDTHWPSSLFLSQDGVAIDSVGLDFLRSEPTIQGRQILPAGSTCENYLHEAALVGSPPSGTLYDPTGAGMLPWSDSLGVHEHWNNAVDKQYGRNLDMAEGIELVRV